MNYTRLTVDGDWINYPGVVSTEAAGITTSKLLFNSVMSTPKASFMGIVGLWLYAYTHLTLPR